MRTLNEMGSMQVIYIALTSIVRLDGHSWAMCSTAVEAWASIAVVKGLNATGVFWYGQEEDDDSQRCSFAACVVDVQFGLASIQPDGRVAYQKEMTGGGGVKLGVLENSGWWDRGEPVSLANPPPLTTSHRLPSVLMGGQLTRAIVLESVIKRHGEVAGPGLPAKLRGAPQACGFKAGDGK